MKNDHQPNSENIKKCLYNYVIRRLFIKQIINMACLHFTNLRKNEVNQVGSLRGV